MAVNRFLKFLIGVALLLAVLMIFIHPAVSSLDAARHRTTLRLLLAPAAMLSALIFTALLFTRVIPVSFHAHLAGPERLALHCERLC